MDSSPFDEQPQVSLGNPLYGSPGPVRQLFPSNKPQNRRPPSTAAPGSASRLNKAGSTTSTPHAALPARTAIHRAAVSQPTYDFLAPAATPPSARRVQQPAQPPPPRPPSAQSNRSAGAGSGSRQGQGMSKLEQANELLRSELNSVRYELSALREERALEKIRHEQETRALEAKCEEQGKRADQVETDKRFLFDKQKELAQQLQKVKDQATNHKQDLERQVRRLKSENTSLKELVSDKQDELDTSDREFRRKLAEHETRTTTLTRTSTELREELDHANATLQELQSRLSEKEIALQNAESEAIQSKAQNGDLETLKILKKELSEQVTHIKNLEATNRRQTAELKQLHEFHKSVEVIEEEKQALEAKVRMMDDLRQELSQAQLRVSILEDERSSWSSYFSSEGLEFDSPESLARALIQERVEKATLLEKSGRTNPELAEKEELIHGMEEEVSSMRAELEKTREAAAKDSKARLRFERQRTLALKEAQFLREQLKSFQTEETVFMQGNYDEQKSARIEELESLLEAYKSELEELRAELVRRESMPGSASPGGRKRSREEENEVSERMGQLSRKNRQLQDEIAQHEQTITLLRKDLSALQHRLEGMENTSTRILQLKDNPTARENAVKASALSALREENAALLAQLSSSAASPASPTSAASPTSTFSSTRAHNKHKLVPLASLEALRHEMAALERTVAEKEKRMQRLKEIWAAKSTEFREAVFSLLGWRLDFLPSGRVRVTHMFSKGRSSSGGVDEESIEFDGEKGTMKVAGGPESAFHKEIKNLCAFWMQRQSMPCLLANILIEQYEKTTRAQA